MSISFNKVKQSYFQYLLLVSTAGVGLLVLSIFQIPSFIPLNVFLLLLGLAIVAQLSTASLPVGSEGITYQVAPAIAAAAIPFFGPFAVVFIDAAAALSLWILKPADEKTWKKSWEQLAFNTGMNALAMFCAGLSFLWLREILGAETVWGQLIPWLAAAVVHDQVNLWLLIGIMRLSQGRTLQPLAIWRENRWAMALSIPLFAIGGWLLSFTIQRFGLLGGATFFLPIVLSSFAFRLYVREMQGHMDNLEHIIADRTHELRKLMKERDAFLAVLTHDMKTPLTSISLYADILLRKPEIILEKPEIAMIFKRNQKALLEIVENILDLEKLQTDEGLQLTKDQLLINQMIGEIVESLEPMAFEKTIRLVFDQPLKPLYVCGDAQQLRRIFQNLLSNAVKYTPEGGEVRIEVSDQWEQIQIVFRDNGIGIPAEDLPYIFDRFRRVKKHEHQAVGTGLGLAIAKALVEAHDGQIEVDSAEGVGSTFSIVLPAYLSERSV